MKIETFAFIIFVLVLSSLCIGQRNLTKIDVDGQTYQFNTNLYDSIKIYADNESKIKSLFDESERICITFDNSSHEDNSLFAVIAYNIVFRATRYYSIRGIEKEFSVCNQEPKIELRGPNTGAKENSVLLMNRTIIIQGKTSKDLEKAGDKLSLIILGIDKLPQS
ncbi:MAG: hypothetical protein QXQ40_00320 [Candidatus Aenigmatarchaeota archaeon]